MNTIKHKMAGLNGESKVLTVEEVLAKGAVVNEVEKAITEQKLLVAVDAGKGYMKVYYEVNGKKKTIIEKSCVAVGAEAKYESTTYIDGIPHDFNTQQKVVETLDDKTKINSEAKALMQRALYNIALKENIYTFDVAMCCSLDTWKNDESQDMKEFMHSRKFEVVENKKKVEIKMDNVIIVPETISSLRFSKHKIKESKIMFVDLGTLNSSAVMVTEGTINRDFYAGYLGYQYIVEQFTRFANEKIKTEQINQSTISTYIDKYIGKDAEFDEIFSEWFASHYIVQIRKEIAAQGADRYTEIVFSGGTSIKLESLLRQSFKKEIEVFSDIHANAKGAYLKAQVELKKIETVNAQ